jgi:hypothetical protein
VRFAARRFPPAPLSFARSIPILSRVRRFHHTGTRQRWTATRVPVLPVANKRFDDFQSGARLAFGASALEIGGQLAVRAKDLLIAHLLSRGTVSSGAAFSSLAHRSPPTADRFHSQRSGRGRVVQYPL